MSPAARRKRAQPTSAYPRTTSARCASRWPTPAMPAMPAIPSWRRASSTRISSGPRAKGIPASRALLAAGRGGQAARAADPHAGRRSVRGFLRSRRGALGRGQIGSGRRAPAVLALSEPDAMFPLVTLASAQENDQTLRRGHRRVRPHPQRHAARDQHRHTQGAEPQPARARGRGQGAAGRTGAASIRATSARSRRSAASCAGRSGTRRPSTTTPAPSP